MPLLHLYPTVAPNQRWPLETKRRPPSHSCSPLLIIRHLTPCVRCVVWPIMTEIDPPVQTSSRGVFSVKPGALSLSTALFVSGSIAASGLRQPALVDWTLNTEDVQETKWKNREERVATVLEKRGHGETSSRLWFNKKEKKWKFFVLSQQTSSQEVMVSQYFPLQVFTFSIYHNILSEICRLLDVMWYAVCWCGWATGLGEC